LDVSYTVPGTNVVIKGHDFIRMRPQGMANQLPVAQFDLTQKGGKVNEPLAIHVNAQGTTDADMDYLKYFWNWGDGTFGEGIDAFHNYLPTVTSFNQLLITFMQVDNQIITISLAVQDPFDTNITATKKISIDMNGIPVVAVPQIAQYIRTIEITCSTNGTKTTFRNLFIRC
jgi:hypothetical protein